VQVIEVRKKILRDAYLDALISMANQVFALNEEGGRVVSMSKLIPCIRKLLDVKS